MRKVISIAPTLPLLTASVDDDGISLGLCKHRGCRVTCWALVTAAEGSREPVLTEEEQTAAQATLMLVKASRASGSRSANKAPQTLWGTVADTPYVLASGSMAVELATLWGPTKDMAQDQLQDLAPGPCAQGKEGAGLTAGVLMALAVAQPPSARKDTLTFSSPFLRVTHYTLRFVFSK